MSAISGLAFIFRCSFFLFFSFFHTISLRTGLYEVPEKIFRKILIPKFSQSKSQAKAFVSNQKINGTKCVISWFTGTMQLQLHVSDICPSK